MFILIPILQGARVLNRVKKFTGTDFFNRGMPRLQSTPVG